MIEPTRKHLLLLVRQLAATAPEELDCDQVLELVSCYFERATKGTPLPPELELVRQHLEVCPDCLEEFHALVLAATASASAEASPTGASP